ncbi:hypothetical protein AKJ50_00550 [candidate division MSBL1 archaeon SCGC-AAA382A13]|uniref:CARDB domain-containing protein n=1 Tax=candidate division MSBL1 archaeon SCGC-AAA382A13 TaxID=1698279 RepID=A0A133VGK0_9EURY|nr:hypothetical protein AKJ50_00550 [candidate division MSBL1 archaeon SCGC-AAA382A13]
MEDKIKAGIIVILIAISSYFTIAAFSYINYRTETEEVPVTIWVKNVGEEYGEREIRLIGNGEVLETKTVGLDPDNIKFIDFVASEEYRDDCRAEFAEDDNEEPGTFELSAPRFPAREPVDEPDSPLIPIIAGIVIPLSHCMASSSITFRWECPKMGYCFNFI